MLTEVLKISSEEPDKEIIQKGAKAIQQGKLVAFPTETVYGIAASALNEQAVEQLYVVKKRSKEKPLTWHIADVDQIKDLLDNPSESLRQLIHDFWPGPLTMILETKAKEKIGFRMPNHPVALALIRAAQVPVLAPSANLSGHPPATTSQEVLNDLNGQIDLVLDGGKTSLGLASTVLDLTGEFPVVLREGAVLSQTLTQWFKEHPWEK